MKNATIDGILYVCIAVFMFQQNFLSSDDVYKYVSPFVVFWSKFVVGTLGAAAGALKMFRSTTFADHQNGNNHEPKP